MVRPHGATIMVMKHRMAIKAYGLVDSSGVLIRPMPMTQPTTVPTVRKPTCGNTQKADETCRQSAGVHLLVAKLTPCVCHAKHTAGGANWMMDSAANERKDECFQGGIHVHSKRWKSLLTKRLHLQTECLCSGPMDYDVSTNTDTTHSHS